MGVKEKQRPSVHWVCRGSARAVGDIQGQDKLLLITYYMPDTVSVAITLNPRILQILCSCHMPGTGREIKPRTKLSPSSAGAYV